MTQGKLTESLAFEEVDDEKNEGSDDPDFDESTSRKAKLELNIQGNRLQCYTIQM